MTSDWITRANGTQICVTAVEAVLLTHPDVREMALVAYPDPAAPGAELAVAVVMVPRSADSPVLADLHEHLEAAGLARDLWPDRLVYTRQMPAGADGETDRAELRRRFEIAASRPRLPSGPFYIRRVRRTRVRHFRD